MPGRRRPRRGRVTQPGNPSTADGGRGCGEGGSSGQSVGGDDYVPDVKHRAGADDGQARTVVMAEKEDQDPADSNGRDGAAESNNDQALVAPKGRCFGDEDAPTKFSLLQHDVNDRPCVCDSGAIDGLTFAEEKESQVAADGGNTGEVVMRKDECFLVDAIMNWSLEDVVNSDLFKDNVHQIPLTFTSVQQYLEIHNSLLLEETRANIQLGLFDLAKGPTYHALSVSPTSDPCVFFIDIDLNIPTDCFHIAEDGDLFLLTTQPHGEFDHTSVCFAVAIEVGRYSCFQRGFRVLVSKYHKDFNLRETKYVSFLTNIMGGITLSKAMTSVERRGSSAVESILWIDEKAKTKICSCGELPIAEFSPPNKFSDEQINALKCILSKLRCPHINAPEVLWGPPGSGKTEIAATVLHSLVEWKFRVLVCVPSEKHIIRFLHKFETLFPSFNLSDMLVLNDMNGVEKSNSFANLSLETRVQELYCCTYTWRSWIKELSFVLEMKPYCQDSCYHEGRICKAKNLMVFCLESFRQKISALILDVRKCSKDLIRSLSGKCLLDNDVANIKNLMTELSQLKNLILNNSLTSSDVHWAFEFSSSLHLAEVANRDIAELMNAKRMSCLKLMDILINSFEFPMLEDRNKLEDFYLGHSRIIICTPSCSSRLIHLKLTLFDTLLVDDASQIKEADLLIPLSMTTKHVFLLGDHLDLQATVKSEVCKKAGYDSSLFKRLLNLSCDKMMLTEQYVMHPSISLFVRSHFYEGKVEDAGNVHSHDYNKQLVDEKLPPYCFFDIMDVDELKVKGKSFVESSVIISLLQSLCKGLKSEIGKLSVAVLCLCSSRIDTIKNRLGTTYASHDRIDLEVNTLDNANESWYDIVILSSVFDTKSELPEGNRINTALTKSRHCLWIICEGANLLDSGGTWEIIYKNANERGTCAKLTSNRISRAMKMLELNDQKRATTTNSSFTGNIMQKPGKEWTWNGRPNNGKDILGSLRDQKNARDTCTLQTTLTTTESLHKFQCSCLDPPQDFPWELCFNDLNSKYEKAAAEKIASEEIGKKRGKYRQETAFEIAKTKGIIGRVKSETEEQERECLFKLESYERVDETLTAEEAEELVEAGSIMACNFRLSRNYFRLRPGDVYVYDSRFPYIHPISGLPVSHAAMVIGHGGQQQPPPAKGPVRHVHIQNSEGIVLGMTWPRQEFSTLKGTGGRQQRAQKKLDKSRRTLVAVWRKISVVFVTRSGV